MTVYIASHDSGGGILRCGLSVGGGLSLIEKYPLDRPSYLCAEGDTLHALLREPFRMQSGIVGFRILGGGALERLGDPEPTHGAVAAYITSVRGRVYCANYLTGSTILMPDRMLAHSGRGADPELQSCSHPHCVTPTPDGNYLCINDLGTDTVHICTPELAPVTDCALPAGSGPRHLVFSGDGRYAYSSNELSSSVSVLAYRPGSLTYLRSYPTVPGDFTGKNSPAAIRLSADGGRLYVSNRGHGSVCVYKTGGGQLKTLGYFRIPGASVREIALAGRYLLCGDDAGGTVTVFPADSGFDAAPVCALPVAHPWCILVLNG